MIVEIKNRNKTVLVCYGGEIQIQLILVWDMIEWADSLV